jgi:16S rRNA C967 or C1407 C5-methylase (RsmB/RsmF family)
LEDTENEAVAGRFLERHRDFSRLSLDKWSESPLDEFVQGPGLWRILTGGDHDGFTVQVFYRSRGAV